MSKNKRKLRKNKKKARKIVWISLVLSIPAIIMVSGFMYLKMFSKKTYISPLPQHASANASVPEDKNMITIEKFLSENHMDMKTISASDSSYFVELKNGSSITFSSKRDTNLQLSSLQLIMSRLTMEGKQFSWLDLRFEKPVIKLRE